MIATMNIPADRAARMLALARTMQADKAALGLDTAAEARMIADLQAKTATEFGRLPVGTRFQFTHNDHPNAVWTKVSDTTYKHARVGDKVHTVWATDAEVVLA